ncbi:MAG TPA: MFS transporter [Jatrophihabitantaceae bacterium]|jgi:DHA2 family integral membrane protein (MFS transporter)
MDPKTIHNRRWAILGVLVICLLVVILDNTILNVALKTIQDDLDASQSQMQWAVDSYALVFAGLLITWGVLGDRLGRRKVLLFGMLTFGATSALCSFASSPLELILFRALMGIGAAAVQPQTLSILQNVFEPHERGKAIGIWAGASGLAIALGPITGGLLLKYFWWGSIFLVNVPIVIAGVVLIIWLVPDSKDPSPSRIDPLGVLLSMIGLVALVYGVIEGGNSNDWLAWNTLGAIVLGIALLAVFVVQQRRTSHPTIDISLFANRHFSAGSVAIAVTFFSLTGATFYLAYFLQAVRGYTPLSAGVALIAVAGAVMIAAPMSARLASRFGARMVTGAGMTIFGVDFCLYAFSTQTMPQWVIELMMFGMGLGMGLTMSPATNAIMGAVPRAKAGAGSAVNNTVRQVASALGVAILGSIVAVVFRNDLGAAAPAKLAAELDRPAAVVTQLPADQQVRPLVTRTASQSIGNALELVGQAATALEQRAASHPASPQQVEQARAAIGTFVAQSKTSFMSAMRITSVFAGLAVLVGAVVAFTFLPGRERDVEVLFEPVAETVPV